MNFMVYPLLFGMQSNTWYFVGLHIVLSECMHELICGNLQRIWEGQKADWTR